QSICILSGSSGHLSRSIDVPENMKSSVSCPIIDVNYFVKVELSTNGAMCKRIYATIPVIIGTIPLQTTETTACTTVDISDAFSHLEIPSSRKVSSNSSKSGYVSCDEFAEDNLDDNDRSSLIT
ncbi:hypothetical protein PFISCL1PPCAC_8930, partial [Pristionchus fissidentatus]